MEIKEFVRNFADQYDDIEVSALTPETAFRDVEGWSSLVALGLIAMVDEEYYVTIKGDDLRACTTVEDVYNVVQSKL